MTTAAQMARLSEYSHGGFSLNPASLIEAHMERSADESTSLSSGIYGGLLRMFSSFASGSGGGGKDDFAQGGGTDASKAGEALAAITAAVAAL